MKTLLFTSIQGDNVETEEDFTTEQIQELAATHGLSSVVYHASIPLQMAMNGDMLYGEIISEDEEALHLLDTILSNVGIKGRTSWDEYLTFTFPKHVQGEEQDSFVIETDHDHLKHLSKEVQERL